MAVTLHTSLGDIKLELYCDLVPRTCEVGRLRIAVGIMPPIHAYVEMSTLRF